MSNKHKMMSDFESRQDYHRRELEGKIIARIARATDGLISTGLRIYLEHPQLEERVRRCIIDENHTVDAYIDEILRLLKRNSVMPSPITPHITSYQLTTIASTSTPQNPIVIVPHDNPDVDAIVSATLLHHIFSQLNIPSRVALRTAPDDITRRIIQENRLFYPDENTLISNIPDSAPLILTDWFSIPDISPRRRDLAVFDHHPTNQNINANIVFEEPYTSASKLIYDVFAEHVAKFDDQLQDEIARNVLYTLFVDSNSMKSTRFNEADRPWMEDTARRLGEDWNHLIDTGYCLNDLSEPVSKLVRNGEKRYNLPNGKKAYISYIMVSNYGRELDDELESELIRVAKEERTGIAMFMICDLGQDETHILELDMSAANGTVEKSSWKTYNDNLSRAKDVYPDLERRNQA